MSVITDAIAASMALQPPDPLALVKIMDAPTVIDSDYGSDLSCWDDVTQNMDELPADSIVLVAQSNYRRITTPRGSLPDDLDYGIDVRSFLSNATTLQRQREIEGIVIGELRKDDRNQTVNCTYTQLAQTSTTPAGFKLSINGTTAVGPYSLTLAVINGQAMVAELIANGTIYPTS